MPAIHHYTLIEFFGGPCDGLQRIVNCALDELKPTTIIPLPFLAERRWFQPAWMFRPRSEAVYALDRNSAQAGYRYLGTVRRESRWLVRSRNRLLRWLRGTFEFRWRVSRGSGAVS